MPKGERCLEGRDDRILLLYARDTMVREIRGHPKELYGVELSVTRSDQPGRRDGDGRLGAVLLDIPQGGVHRSILAVKQALDLTRFGRINIPR